MIGGSPMAIFAPALGIIVLLGYAFLRTGRKSLLVVAGGVFLVAMALLIVQYNVITERQRVEATLRQIASLVEQNRIPEVLDYAASDADLTRSAAERELSRYEFGEVDIKPNLEIEVFEEEAPMRAIARFNATVFLKSDPSGFASNRRIARYVELTFKKEGDAWKVSSYTHHEPTFSLRRRDER